MPVRGKCRIWQGARNADGYGCKRHGGKVEYVHRLAYEAEYGPIPEGTEIDHACENKACYRASHLEAVPHAENIRRAKSSLDWQAVEEIRASEEPSAVLAERFGVSSSSIHKVRTGQRWKAAA